MKALLLLSILFTVNLIGFTQGEENEVYVLVPPRYENVNDYSEGLAAVQISGKWGYVNKYGEYIVKPKYKETTKFSEGMAAVRIGESWGFIDVYGDVMISFQYIEVRDFKEGVAAVNKDGFWGGVNKSGETVIPFKYDNVHSYSEGLAVTELGEYVKDGGQIYKVGVSYSYVNHSGGEAIKMYEREVLNFSEGFAPVKEDGQWGFIDRAKKVGGVAVKYDSVQQFSEGLAAVMKKGAWGFIDKKGQAIIGVEYEDVGSFSEGLASARDGGKWGVINSSNDNVVDFKYDTTAVFSDDLALVKANNKFGFINKEGEEVIAMEFGEARTFASGAAAIKVKGKWGFITLNYMKPNTIEGKLMAEIDGKSQPLSDATVKLSNSLDSAVTDKNGAFVLNADGYSSDLILKVKTDKEPGKVTLYTTTDERVGDLNEKSRESFEYRLLKNDYAKMLELEEEEVEMVFKGRLLTEEKGKKVPLSDAVVKFTDGEGSTVTDSNGDFTLKTDPYAEEVNLEVTTTNKVENVIVATGKGEEIAPMKLIEKGSFEYRFLKNEYSKMNVPEEEEVTPLFRGKILTKKAGKKVPVSDASVQFSNSDEVAFTDKYGDFQLSSNGYNEGAVLKVTTDDDLYVMILATQGGEDIATMKSNGGGVFEYKLLKNEYAKMVALEEEDVEMVFNRADKSEDLNVSQQIHYAFGKYKVQATSYPVLDKIANIMKDNPSVKLEIISHTDAVGASSFNMKLSKMRAEAVIDYLVLSGVSAKRLTPVGKGETEIRNRCTDLIDCSESEHEYNRRTEFKFVMK